MKSANNSVVSANPSAAIAVIEKGVAKPRRAERCEIGRNVRFSTSSLESYFFAGWEPVVYDALLVAAAVEFADRTVKRPELTWSRRLQLTISVHDVDLWNEQKVSATLKDALEFLTGDDWNIGFVTRKAPAEASRQGLLSLATGVDAVIPFSNGLDSRAVASLVEKEKGRHLVRIRLGSRPSEAEELEQDRQPFTAVPYKVRGHKGLFVESSARSRGFKFALISAIAAYLARATEVIVPESGQGALGPALVVVGQAYPDFRSHPLFTRRMEALVKALLGHSMSFVFPRLWSTKGETLRDSVKGGDQNSWKKTWSCWRQNRHVSVEGKRRQCGICAACMLRRMSVHAAGLSEDRNRYVWQNLSARDFADGAARSYREKGKITEASRQYAIAGALHLDHLAGLAGAKRPSIDLAAFQLSGALGLKEADVHVRLDRLLRQHKKEWASFVSSLGKHSFVANWAPEAVYGRT